MYSVPIFSFIYQYFPFFVVVSPIAILIEAAVGLKIWQFVKRTVL